MNYHLLRTICLCRSIVFSNSATGAMGDSTVDPDAATIDPNQHLAPIVGGSKTFNIAVIVALVLVAGWMAYLTFKLKK